MWLKQGIAAVSASVADCCGSVLKVILTTVFGAYFQAFLGDVKLAALLVSEAVRIRLKPGSMRRSDSAVLPHG